MAHRHLLLAYALTWALQLGYVGLLAVKWRALKRAESPGAEPGRSQ
jgi:hypothetical protein